MRVNASRHLIYGSDLHRKTQVSFLARDQLVRTSPRAMHRAQKRSLSALKSPICLTRHQGNSPMVSVAALRSS
jgi:hypothetical protein